LLDPEELFLVLSGLLPFDGCAITVTEKIVAIKKRKILEKDNCILISLFYRLKIRKRIV
jgi:hypothetical protein